MHYVIIGNGVAGTVAAETLRRFDPDGSITMIGDEAGLPYCRPMISLYLEGAVSQNALPIRLDDFYNALGITPVLGNRVVQVDTDNKQVRTADDKPLSYDKLLIATGSDPRPAKADNESLQNIFFMRTQSQVEQMLTVLPNAKHALVLGGGLVGFKAAYGLLRRGIKVSMLIRSPYPLSMQVDETAGQMIRRVLENQGLNVQVGVQVSSFEGDSQVREAVLTDGSRLVCDLAVIGKGVFPAHDFLPKDKIAVDAGIRVNGHMQTSDPDIYAAGDVAEYIDIARQKPWVNAIWPEAVIQGEIAGMNMAGRPYAYAGSLSRNVIRIFDTDVMTAGLVSPSPDDTDIQVMSHIDPKRATYRKLVFREDRLIGFALVNRIEQGGVLTALIRSQQPVAIAKDSLMAPDFNFSKLMLF